MTSTAVPTEAAIWRSVLFSAVPCGMRCCGSWFSAAVVTGMITMAMPNMRTALTMAM